jgi:hypothetical protein
MEAIPPPLPGERRSWFSRHWYWLVPAIVVVLVGCGFALYSAIMSVMRSSDVYKMAVARAVASPALAAEMGTPIREGFFTAGSVVYRGTNSTAQLVIPLRGPLSNATVFVTATKPDGTWHYDQLVARVDETGHRVDLSDPPVRLRK